MRSFAGRDILSLKEFERNEFFHVFDVAQKMEPIARSRKNVDMLREKTMVTAFYQPSTRTRLAHEATMHRLGGLLGVDSSTPPNTTVERDARKAGARPSP